MISLLWKNLVGGGCIGRQPDRELHGYDALSLVYGTLELLRIDTIVSFPLACEESDHSSLSGKMGRCSPHHGGLLTEWWMCWHMQDGI